MGVIGLAESEVNTFFQENIIHHLLPESNGGFEKTLERLKIMKDLMFQDDTHTILLRKFDKK